MFSPPSGGGQQQQPQVAAPTPVPPAPDRSDADIASAAALQRKKYGLAGGMSNNMGMSVPSGSAFSAVTAMLGGGSSNA